jgi:hypothetical protein
MAVEHVDTLNAETHEPKHITDATTGDNGKIITPSSATNAVSVLEAPKMEKMNSIDVSADTNAVAGTLFVADGSGGMVAEPAGAAGVTLGGLIRGSMGFHGATDTTTVADTNYHPIDTGWGGAGIVAGELNGMTFSSGLLTATYAGTYAVVCSFSLTLAAGTNDVLEWDISVDGTEIGKSQKRYIANTTDIESMSIADHVAMTAGQTIGLEIKVDTTDNLTVHGFNFDVIRLGP